jgi:hypothetical protein
MTAPAAQAYPRIRRVQPIDRALGAKWCTSWRCMARTTLASYRVEHAKSVRWYCASCLPAKYPRGI